ncbi:hypothetical protein E2986_13353 [Frieseomelitta varia]|uniref:Uncharacterized protein n=1 Tax=Frieseomelitta varia TaxID=561572 RepID=A0A833VMU0_9HYME|nr:hypothetical protein E2986_13353 [Frieseomelitta varia]
MPFLATKKQRGRRQRRGKRPRARGVNKSEKGRGERGVSQLAESSLPDWLASSCLFSCRCPFRPFLFTSIEEHAYTAAGRYTQEWLFR